MAIYRKERTDTANYKDITEESYALVDSETDIKIWLFGIYIYHGTYNGNNNSKYRFKEDVKSKKVGFLNND